MNKTLFASSAFLTLSIFSQAVFADVSKQISAEDLAAIKQDYQLEYNAQAQPRRSALFAHILDSLSQSTTTAKASADFTAPVLSDLEGSPSTSVTL